MNKTCLVLSVFDDVLGPSIKYSVPSKITHDKQDLIRRLMDVNPKPGFFGHISADQNYIANYLFEIRSKFSRGRKKTLLISFISSNQFDFNDLEPVLEEFASKTEAMSDLHLIFHNKKFPVEEMKLYLKNQVVGVSEEQDSNGSSKTNDIDIENAFNSFLKEQKNKFSALLQECYKECDKLVQNAVFARLLVIGANHSGKSSYISMFQKRGMIPQILEDKQKIGFKICKILTERMVFNIYDLRDEVLSICYDYNLEKVDAILFMFDISRIHGSLDKQLIGFRKFLLNFYTNENSIGGACESEDFADDDDENTVVPMNSSGVKSNNEAIDELKKDTLNSKGSTHSSTSLRIPLLILMNKKETDRNRQKVSNRTIQNVVKEIEAIILETLKMKEIPKNLKIMAVSVKDPVDVYNSFHWLIHQFLTVFD